MYTLRSEIFLQVQLFKLETNVIAARMKTIASVLSARAGYTNTRAICPAALIRRVGERARPSGNYSLNSDENLIVATAIGLLATFVVGKTIDYGHDKNN